MVKGNMTRNDWLRLASVVIVFCGSLALLYPFWPLKAVIPLGLDLQGGVRLVLQAKATEGMSADQKRDTLDKIVTILSNRVDQYGMANAEIKRLGTDRVLVNVPGTTNPEEARRLIGQTAMLEFRKVIEAGTTPNSDLVPTSAAQEVLRDREGIPYIVESEALLSGAALSDARVRVSQSVQQAGQMYIALSFSQDGAQQFVKALNQLKVDDRLAIVLDGIVYSAPRITDSIKQAAAQGWRQVQNETTITGRFTRDEATRIGIVLRAGALPVAVEPIEEVTVGPTLGSDSVRRGMITIVAGFAITLIYMTIYYRTMGLAADCALVLNMLIMFAALRLFHATLTLPGIAGIVLTIGMSVDANVVINERIKEQRRAGKAPLAAVKAGFAMSVSALVDANLTNLIVAVILLLVGTGPVKGFAITLGIGVVGSLYAAYVLCRLLQEKTPLGRHIPVRVSSPEN